MTDLKVEWEYIALVHPDGKTWAIGWDIHEQEYVTRWGKTHGLKLPNGDSGYVFTHQSDPKPYKSSEVYNKLNQKLDRGYYKFRDKFYDARNVMALAYKRNILIPVTYKDQENPLYKPEESIESENIIISSKMIINETAAQLSNRFLLSL